MRQRLRLVLGLAMLAGCAGDPAPQAKNDIIAHALATTVQVVAERTDDTRRSGSGVILGSDAQRTRSLVLTTDHLLASAVEQTILLHPPGGGQPIEASVLATDPDADLALLAIPGQAAASVTLRSTTYLGDPVWVVAFPWGGERTVVAGVVSQIVERAAGAPSIGGPVRLVDASVSYGMSGGGVFDARSGTLIGLVRGYRTAELALPGQVAEPIRFPVAGETTVVPAQDILCFLAAAGIGEPGPAAAAPEDAC